MKKIITPLSILALIILCTYSGCGLLSPSPKETLPPATQTGANTFGCYVNGKLWVPKGYDGTSNLILNYDPTFNKGTFDLRSYRYPNSSTWFQSIILASDSLSATGLYMINDKHQDAQFMDSKACNYYGFDATVNRTGTLTITKFDLAKGIISGTFQFTLSKPACDTIKITQGRFDMKL
jgi:hypothetical protein